MTCVCEVVGFSRNAARGAILSSQSISLPPSVPLPISVCQGYKKDPVTAGQLYVSVDGIMSNIEASKDQNLFRPVSHISLVL